MAFWSRYCAPSARQLPALAALARRADSLGASVVTITTEASSAELREYLAEHHLGMPIFVDDRYEARRAFRQFATPQLYVLDGRGHLRFELPELGAVPAQLVVLRDIGR